MPTEDPGHHHQDSLHTGLAVVRGQQPLEHCAAGRRGGRNQDQQRVPFGQLGHGGIGVRSHVVQGQPAVQLAYVVTTG